MHNGRYLYPGTLSVPAYLPNCSSTSITFLSYGTYRYESAAERAMRSLLEEFGRDALQVRLRRQQANKKAMLDAKSRARRAPAAGPARGQRLQTYDGALAARMAARRVA